MGFRAPDKKTFDKWIIDGVAYEAGTTYVVEHDVSVTPLWKDVKSDDDDGPKPPVPTPDDPVKPPVPAPDDKWHNHKGNGTNNGANGTNNGADGAPSRPRPSMPVSPPMRPRLC